MTNDARKPLAPPMFPGIRSKDYGFEPTADEMELARERARFAKTVFMTGYKSHTFDLSNPDQVEAYEKLRMEVYEKAKMGEIVIHLQEHMQFNDDSNPRWVVHIEYSTYRFEKVDRTEQQEPEQ